MRRLYFRIYLGIVLVIALFAVLAGVLRWIDVGERGRDRNQMIESVSATVAELLPPADAPVAELDATLSRLAGRFDADAAVYTADGAPIAGSGVVPAPPTDGESGFVHGDGGPAFALRLPDGRWLVASRGDGRRGRPWLVLLVLAAVVIAVGAYPLARRVTRRLERLQAGVETLGAGDLSARVAVEGRDEVARLATAFNQAAARIEELVQSQRATLAGASHELRSPLTRIRMAAELLGDDVRADLRESLERDVEELDGLIEELLLASRLSTQAVPPSPEPVSLDDVLREECDRVEARCQVEPATLHGDPRLLRRMMRNLLENARKHGGSEIVASLSVQAGEVLLVVEDDGPGVAEELRERIFEPFFRPPGLREGRDPGVGLGLALVRQIARHHGGDVCCEASALGGSRFRVRMPLPPPAA